jgi:acetylornithine deacetylase/succinyl-diaminopimelate desuccinylase-like protein
VIRIATTCLLFMLFACTAASHTADTSANVPVGEIVVKVRQYRKANEHRLVQELSDLLAIPNTASDASDIQRNATKLAAMLKERGMKVQLLPIKGRGPVVFGSLETPGAARTVIFYCHYDGQPVEQTGWISTKPFEPALRTASIDAGGQLIHFPKAITPYQDEWRIYARSASDDKSPIVAILAALDALRSQKIPLAMNLKMVLEGEEEDGSPHLEETLLAHRDLLAADLLISADGPVHQSGRPLLYFGNRGVVGARITVYGPLHSLHSGHYGNWAPNPAMRLAQLLASMKDTDGRVLIDGFYDEVEPLGEAERRAIEQAPVNDAELMRHFGIAQPDGGGKKLLELVSSLPSLNVDGMESGWTGAQSKNIIPDRAYASLDMRLVKNIQPEKEFERLVRHIRKQGYLVIDREPTQEERLECPLIARVVLENGYPAAHTSMDLPVSEAITELLDSATGESTVRISLLGGSAPLYIFERMHLPVIGVPIVNFDNNQHSSNENVRLGNFWRGIEIYGAILGALRW